MNRIRLTESQLHNVIRRCVNEALEEMDWKTYANAARKQADRLIKNPDLIKTTIIGGKHDPTADDRLRNFKQAMENAYNRDYGFNSLEQRSGFKKRDEEGYFEMPFEIDNIGAYGYYDTLSAETGLPKQNKYFPGTCITDRYRMSSWDGNDKPKYKHEKNVHKGYRENDIQPQDDQPYMKASRRGNKEIEDYQNGNYEYIKGKGWQLRK